MVDDVLRITYIALVKMVGSVSIEFLDRRSNVLQIILFNVWVKKVRILKEAQRSLAENICASSLVFNNYFSKLRMTVHTTHRAQLETATQTAVLGVHLGRTRQPLVLKWKADIYASK